LFFAGAQPAAAQLGFELDIKKPEPYENRELKAEKTGDKKLKAPRRFMQNLTTHYNYFFNAQTKLNEIIDRAKSSDEDDYSLLLPFYNYSLNTTAADSSLLDSVIAKAKTGIVLHDLRSDWVDNMYLLWGASYYFKQQFDSARQMFQFINYAFADKEADGYYKYIGSRLDGNTTAGIATKEDRGTFEKLLSEPPSRNNAFIWQIRTMIQQSAFADAGNLISILKTDPDFPARLRGDLEEVQAFWFYRQGMWDSAAHHLVNALSEAGTKQEKARWEYLAGQLFEKAALYASAKEQYEKAIAHTTDPLMDIYARLNLIRMNKEGGDEAVSASIAQLVKMARRDKYEDYRAAIYSMAAQMELERGNFAGAQLFLLKASSFKTENIAAANRAYLQLADLSYARKDYLGAISFYDSIQVQDLKTEDAERITERKDVLNRLRLQHFVIQRQDSLQKIASLPEEERTAYVTKLVRHLRRQQGLKEDDVLTSGRATTTTIPDPFSTQQTKGEWYFNNEALKTSGAISFKQTWGNRPNVDNWRRFSDVTAQLRQNVPQSDGRGTGAVVTDVLPNELTAEALIARLPLSPEGVQASNDSILRALEVLGFMYSNELEDYASAVEMYEEIQRRFPAQNLSPDVLMGMYYSYQKGGSAAKAAEIKNEMLEKYPSDRNTVIVATGNDPESAKPSKALTQTYEGIYDLFLEGKFAEANAAKLNADSMYQTNYWSPQLLYIQAVYYIKQRQDSLGASTLNTLIAQNGGTPIAQKAENLVAVLARRGEIEAELADLQVTRPKEDSLFVEPVLAAPKVEKANEVTVQKPEVAVAKPPVAKQVPDSAFKKQEPIKKGPLFSFNANAPHFAVVVLNKVDPVFANEARNAFNRYNKEKFYNQPLNVTLVPVNDDVKLLIIESFTNAQAAVEYVQKTKPIAAGQIVPWLKSDKFTFSIISVDNLEAVTNTKDVSAYQKFIDGALGAKF